MIREHAPEVAVLDVSMPGASIPLILADIAERALPTRVLVLTGNNEPSRAAETLAAGAHGFLLKDNAFDDVAKAIRVLAGGGTYIDPQIASQLLQVAPGVKAAASLTGRQLEILRMVAAGHTSRRIAGHFGLHVKTIDNHRQRIREKLGVKSAAEMIRVAKERGLI
jgi:DNA-binding NarL/FixJ family response regulator